MSEKDDEIVLPADVRDALEAIYRLHPRTSYQPSKRNPSRRVSLPIPPRAAPRRAFASAGERVGARYPDWVAALWCCITPGFGMLVHREAHEVARQLCEADQGARQLGAPAELVFFDVLGEGEGAIYFGTDRLPSSEDAAPLLYELRAGVRDPAKALRHQPLVEKLRHFARSAAEADDTDVFSKETWASIQAVRRAKQPPFELRWEHRTPGLPAPPPAPPAPPPLFQRVCHPSFGEGTVVARRGTGDKEKLEIDFDEGDRRTILARFVTPV